MSQSIHFSVLDNVSKARVNMVESQIRAGGTTNPLVLQAMSKLPRENFIKTPEGALAYAEMDGRLEQTDSDSPRYLLNPPLLARLIDAAGIHDGDLVLDIGCANGYSSAILSDLVGIGTVIGLESDSNLVAQATQQLENLGKDNVVITQSKLLEGYAKQGPYDVILLNGASAIEPKVLESIFIPQLREQGRFVGIFDDGGDIKGVAWRWTKTKDGVRYEALFDARAPILPSFEALKMPFRFPGIVTKKPSLNLEDKLSSETLTKTAPEQEKIPSQEKRKETLDAHSPTPSAPNADLKNATTSTPAPTPASNESEKASTAKATSALAPTGRNVLKMDWRKMKNYTPSLPKVSMGFKKALKASKNLLPKKQNATSFAPKADLLDSAAKLKEKPQAKPTESVKLEKTKEASLPNPSAPKPTTPTNRFGMESLNNNTSTLTAPEPASDFKSTSPAAPIKNRDAPSVLPTPSPLAKPSPPPGNALPTALPPKPSKNNAEQRSAAPPPSNDKQSEQPNKPSSPKPSKGGSL